MFDWSLGSPAFELWQYGRIQERLDFSELIDRPLISPRHEIDRQSPDFTTESGRIVSHNAGVRLNWTIGFTNCRAMQANALSAWVKLLNFMVAPSDLTREIRFFPHGGHGTYYLVLVSGDFAPVPWQEVYAILQGSIELTGQERGTAIPDGV